VLKFFGVIESHAENAPPFLISEFTNFLNVFRVNYADNSVPVKLKSKIVKRVQAIFS